MSRRFTRLKLLSVLAVSSNAWAIGLGDIKLNSALNEPLRAEIALLSATPDEIAGLSVSMASVETFARYGIDRPVYLQGIEFNIENGGVAGSIVRIRSHAAITEPFLTFLVEASWASGRLLREYTVLLDPPTFAPPAVQQAPAVTAPRRSTSSDSARIERPPESVQAPPNASTREIKPQAPADDRPFDTSGADSIVVARGDTLWALAARMRPDSRLSMNQTMLAIYEANQDAFGGNINLLKEGARLRLPSADEIFQISRGEALNEVQRQNSAWGLPGDSAGVSTGPVLTLVPPDDEIATADFDDAASAYEPLSREEAVEDRIRELEEGDVPDQYSLIEIRDNELASLRQELANIRGEVYEPAVDDAAVSDSDDVLIDDIFVDDTQVDDQQVPADSGADDNVRDPVATAADDTTTASDTASRAADDSIVDKILEYAASFWVWIGLAVIAVVGLLTWFVRRGGDDVDDDRPWETLDAADDIGIGALSATETMQAPSIEEAIVVVEEDSGVHTVVEETLDAPTAASGDDSASGSFGSLEDTFSSETAINLDQTDPVAEADFHMAYGLYDQAADLINGALESDPSDKTLMSKLCEIYFVWGNRDAFVDAASKLKSAIGDDESSDWVKIVIMGQQIAADHDLFAGAGVVGAAGAVDLSIGDDADQSGVLDMDFGTQDDQSVDVLDMDFGSDDASAASEIIDLSEGESGAGIDFLFDDATAENQTIDMPIPDPNIDDGGTSELPSLDESLGQAITNSGLDSDATAEINLDELDLDVAGLAETEIASLDDLDETGEAEALVDTGINEALGDPTAVTGRNLEINENLDATSEMKFSSDDVLQMDTEFDASLLDATGLTEVLAPDMAVDTLTAVEEQLTADDATLLAPSLADGAIAEDIETAMASLDGDVDFDFAKTEALPADSFGGDHDATAEAPTIAATDVDLDLDDLTAALKVSEIGDTIEHIRDAETVEQPRPAIPGATAEVPTMELSADDMSGDLQEARTMTEVGTKLDLARAYVDMGDPAGARGILDEVLDEGDDAQKQQAQQLLDSLPS
jgi:pilus assembly protein FimV